VTLALVAKAIVIALLSALVAWFPAAIFWTLDLGPELKLATMMKMLSIALLGSFCVGLPVAAITLILARNFLISRPATVLIMANFAAAMMALASYALGGIFAVLMLGAPAFLAANTYATLGLVWIIHPMRKTLNSPPQEKEIA